MRCTLCCKRLPTIKQLVCLLKLVVFEKPTHKQTNKTCKIARSHSFSLNYFVLNLIDICV